MQFVRHDISIDFVGKRKYAAVLSVILVISALGIFFFGDSFGRGPNWGIDFTGGTEIQLKFDDPIDIAEVRAAISAVGIPDDAVQQIGNDDTDYAIRVQDASFGSESLREEIEAALTQEFGAEWVDEVRFDAEVGARMTVVYTGDQVPMDRIRNAVADFENANVQEANDDNTFYVKLPGFASKVTQAIGASLEGKSFETVKVDSVGPKVGGDLRRQGFISLGATLLLILVYVGFRFDLAFAPGAVLALFHDVTITIGLFVLIGREFNLPIIGALLTIIGYSLNDTIVIYDRIRENTERYRRKELTSLINTSINETLGRTLATSLTTALAIFAFLFMGGPVIQTFALAMLIGIVIGTYSTVFVASPMILVMQDVKPHLAKLLSVAETSSPEAAAGVKTKGNQEKPAAS